MSNFSHINLLAIEDGTPSEIEGITGRFGRKFLDSRDLGVSLFSYAPGFRASGGHVHREQEEAYVVVDGSGEALVDGEVIKLSKWDVVRVAPAAVRAFAAGPDGLELIAIGGPKPEGGDGARADISWPDGDAG